MAGIRDFPMPDLGEGLTEGEITRWLVAVGDRVAVDQPVAEISTEKAVVEVPTPFAGVVAALHGAAGEVVAVGRPLISVDTGADPASAVNSGESGNVLVGYGTSSAEPRRRRRARALAAGGAHATVPSPAASATAVAAAAKPPATTPAPGAAPAAVAPAPNAPGTPAARRITTPSSPLVRRLAAELGVDLATITGTGPGGVVSRADLERAVAAASPPPAAAATEEAERIRLTGPRRIAAERLARSHREAPDAAAWLTADATGLLELRDLVEARHRGLRVTPLAVLLRLCAAALQRFPLLNAHFDAERGETVVLRSIHLGVAVQAQRGLLVPVIRDTQARSVTGIAEELARLAAAARDGSIAAAELSGSTFTVSNFGAFGVDGGTPIINPPEAAILGVGRISERPWVVGGAVVPRPLLELSLVFDHRVCDGGTAGGFLRLLGDLVEHPALALAD